MGVQKTHLDHFAHEIERARVCHGPYQVVEPSLLLELGLSLKHVSMNARASGDSRLKRAAFVHLLRAVYLSATCWGWNSLLQAAVDLGEFWNCKYCSGAKQRIVKFGGLLAAIKSCRGTAKGWDCGRHRAPERAA